ncbi:translational GTPase TypA [Proteinivorax hydrogeniformans]|uniref:Large ribosomal subunit assembly factor BipA n=1 Tax=Proteinivorax hydrogeniformans TaxID=1826727 RepID=A0AAU8HQ00_9FIRM
MDIQQKQIRNIAIVAHVDHGKTTLVDELLKQSGVYHEKQQVEERVMDSNALERERGITILAKNTSVMYKDIKINIVDTPGHADFGGEVERTLSMVDNVLLVVDAFEGPMPQTRFVLKKALELKLKPIVVVNKADRPNARPAEVIDEVLDLFISLDADDEQLEFPVIYTSAIQGWASTVPNEKGENLLPLFEMIESICLPPTGNKEVTQMMVTNIEYNEFIGRIAIGKLQNGTLEIGQNVSVITPQGDTTTQKIGKIFTFDGLNRREVSQVDHGEIIAISGLQPINIGETISSVDNPKPLRAIKIDEPTITMTFGANTSPFAGLEGDYVTSRHLKSRLEKELETNVSLHVSQTESKDKFLVAGRGELHLSILIETMRREGYEFEVSRPKVIFKEIEGKLHEPIERVFIEVPSEFSGAVIEKLGAKKAELVKMENPNPDQTRLEFLTPARSLIGFRAELLTDTKGNGIINHTFEEFQPYKGEIPAKNKGSLIASDTGEATNYGLFHCQERGTLFVGPHTKVYTGMVVGQSTRNVDIDVNVCKKKQVTNMRASGSDENIILTPPTILSLEQSLEFIGDDELLEVTPDNLRIRKVQLDSKKRIREWKSKQGK